MQKEISFWHKSFDFFQPEMPRKKHFVSTKYNKPEVLEPIPYEFIA